RGFEESASDFGPVIGGSDCQCFLSLEVMEERTLGDAGASAQLVDGARGVTLLTDQRKGCIQEFLTSRPFRKGRRDVVCHGLIVPTSRYVVNATSASGWVGSSISTA